MPNTDDPRLDDTKPDDAKTDGPKPDEPQSAKRAGGELSHALEGIKTAQEELARLDRVVSRMERGDDVRAIRQKGTGVESAGASAGETPVPQKRLESRLQPPAERRSRPMLLALVGFLLAIGFGAAFASRYGNPAQAIMARWAPPEAVARDEAPRSPDATKPPDPATTLMAQATTATPQQPSPPAAPNQKDTKDVPPAGTTASADVAQSLQNITRNLASISEKLDQLKSGYDQKLREQADALQQLKTAQENDAREKERTAAQIQAMQAQLAALPAKPAPPQTAKKETEAAVHQRPSVAFQPPRPRRSSAPWRPRPYMDSPYYDDPYW